MKLKKLFPVLLLLLALLLTSACAGDGGENKQPSGGPPAEKPEVGFTAPDFELSTANGDTVRLSGLRGTPVFLNFWATDCPYCREEMPDIQEVHEDLGGEVQILTVNMTFSEKSVQNVKEFISGGGYTFPVLMDIEGTAAQKYLVRGIPVNFFIDSQGIIRHRQNGAMNQEQIKKLINNMQ